MALYKLTYFQMRGRAEALRLLFAVADVPYENVRVSMEKFAEMRPNLPYGELPVVEHDGLVMSQSYSIGRFLAKKFGLHGSNDLECYKMDELSDAMCDYFNVYWELWDPVKGPHEASVKRFLETSTPKYLNKLNSVLVANGGKFLVGNKLSWVDILLFNALDYYEYLTKLNLTKDYPALQSFKKEFGSIPKIRQWIEKRPMDDI